tara:strand:- start:193 stop:663 length:471 start_codon:yes stop_codon:yes gene_type:complete
MASPQSPNNPLAPAIQDLQRIFPGEVPLNLDALVQLMAMQQFTPSGMAKDVMADPVGYMPRNMRGRANHPIPQAPDDMNPESWRDRNILAERGRHMRSNPRAGQRDRYPGRGTKFRPPTSAIGGLGFRGMGGSARNPMLDFLDALIRQAGYTKTGK